ncbi:MAG: S1 RNA-binding domain-containing protein [Candidatus Margulisiibacteriota bacterium]
MPLETGLEVEGKVTGITNFGAFMELPEKLVGLVHISQVSDSYVTDISKHIRIGDVLKVKVLGVNKEGKYDLSIKQVGKTVWTPPKPKKPREEYNPQPGNFEDKLTMFLKQSDEKQLDWKRNLEYKQVGKKKKLK